MGDYSTNIALIAKKNPQEICDALLSAGGDKIEKCEIAGPGFVNIFLKDDFLRAQLGKIAIPNLGGGAKVIVEYSSPNIAKPMHVGHLRSTVIGDALANVYEALGYDVVRWNYIGDWGTQFGKLIAGYKRWEPTVATIHDMVQLYVRASRELDEAAGREEFKKLEEGDEENRRLWKLFRDESLKEFEKMYAQLGTKFTVTKGESDYQGALKGVADRLKAQGIAVMSEGATIVPLEDLAPLMVVKSDGGSTYAARDIASIEDRVAAHSDVKKILYVVANQQALHFEQLFEVIDKMKRAGMFPTGALPEFVHVKFGMVCGEDGKKLATREGNAIPLQEVIDKIIALAAERNPETARAIGIGALKYNDLRQNPHTDIVFDWKAMLDLGGNSGPYVQYAYARLAGIIAKTKSEKRETRNDLQLLVHPTERALMRHLLDFGDAVAGCAREHALNGLALYLYELAEKSNRFYEQVRVSEDENDARKSARLELVDVVMNTLKQGLALLGIQVLERI